jgi:hypothetical protein
MFKTRWSDKKEHDITSMGEKINDLNQIQIEIIKPKIEDENTDN